MEDLFLFEDIACLSDGQIKELLSELESQDIATALRINNNAVDKAIARNASESAWDMIASDRDWKGPVDVNAVDAAQRTIVETVFSLFGEEGKLRLVVDGEKKTFCLDSEVFIPENEYSYEVMKGKTPEGTEFAASFEDLIYCQPAVKSKILSDFSLREIYVASRECDFGRLILPVFANRTGKYLENRYKNVSKEESLAVQKRVTSRIVQLVESGEIHVPREFCFEDIIILDDRDTQKILRAFDPAFDAGKSEELATEILPKLNRKKIKSFYDEDMLSAVINVLVELYEKKNPQETDDFLDFPLSMDEADLKKIYKEYGKKTNDGKELYDNVEAIVRDFATVRFGKLILALKDCSKELKEKFFCNMGKSQQKMIQIAMECFDSGECTSALTEKECRKEILSVVKKLEDSGEILINKKNGSYMI